MADLISLGEMRQEARERADMASGGSAQFVTDDEVNRYLNRAGKRLHARLVSARGSDYYAVRTDIPVVAGTATYSLPSDFLQLNTLQLKDGDRSKTLQMYMLAEEDRLLNGTFCGIGDVMFRLQSESVLLLPTPTKALTLVVNYAPKWTDLAADGETFDGIAGFEEWLVLTATIAMLGKQGSSWSHIENERKMIDDEINEISVRRANQPLRIVDTRRD